MKRHVVIGVCLVAGLLNAGVNAGQEDNSAPSSGKPAETTKAAAKGNPLFAGLEDGKPVVAIFSARTCCGGDPMPDVALELQARNSNVVHVVHVDAFRERDVALQCGVETIPTVFVYDAKGNEKARLTETVTAEDIEAKMVEVGLK